MLNIITVAGEKKTTLEEGSEEGTGILMPGLSQYYTMMNAVGHVTMAESTGLDNFLFEVYRNKSVATQTSTFFSDIVLGIVRHTHRPENSSEMIGHYLAQFGLRTETFPIGEPTVAADRNQPLKGLHDRFAFLEGVAAASYNAGDLPEIILQLARLAAQKH